MAPFSLTWGQNTEDALQVLGAVPIDRGPDGLAYELDTLIARLASQGSFCPSLFLEHRDDIEGQLHLAFRDQALVGVEIRFRYGFEAIGKSPDGLSDLSMAAYARFELQQLLFELTARYGPPVHKGENAMRWGHAHPVGTVLFRTAEQDTLMVMLGHDGSGLVGQLRYLPEVGKTDGF